MQGTEKIWGGLDASKPAFSVAGGAEKGFELPMDGRGTLTKVMVVQLSGSLEGFSYTIYNNRKACPPGNNPTSVAAGNGVPEQLYRVVGPVTVATAKDHFDGNGAAWPNSGVYGTFIPYHNTDGDQSTNAGYALYIKIAPAGTGAKTFGVALTTCQWTF